MLETKGSKFVLGPTSYVLEALINAEFTKPKIRRKPNGQEIKTRLVLDGCGMAGIEDRVENREWAGILNHYVKTAGAAFYIGRLLQLNGQDVNLQLMLDTVMLSHSGRRQYDEAVWYPNEVGNATEKRNAGDTQIGLKNLKNKNLPEELIEMISVHCVGFVIPSALPKTWNEKLPMLLDYRIGQKAVTLEERFAYLKEGVVSGRFTPEWWDTAYNWAIETESRLFDTLSISSYEVVVQNPENLKARIDTAIKLGKFKESEAKILKTTKLYKPKSGQQRDFAEIAGLTKEEFLDRLQLNPEDINDRLLQPERWERYVRRLYINDAEQEIFDHLSKLHESKELEKEFAQNTWWGKYTRELYVQRYGVPFHPRAYKQKHTGIARAIEFYRQIEQNRLNS